VTDNLENRLVELEHRIATLEDVNALRKLHHAYAYYLDKCMYQEVVELFAEDGEVLFHGGRYKGKAGVRRLYIDRFQQTFTNGHNGPIDGFLLDHMQSQDIVTVSPDRKTAKMRVRCFMQAGSHEATLGKRPLQQWWEGGLYENDYVNEDGVWKIKSLDYRALWHAEYEKGWAHTRPEFVPFPTVTYPEDPNGPDELLTDAFLWPTHKVIPFHYDHPVTGEPNEYA